MNYADDDHAVDYDAIAPTYARRYEVYDYSGVDRTLLDFVGPGPSGRVLEVGCGAAHWLNRLGDRAELLIGIDPSEGMLQRSHSGRFSLVRGRAGELPWPGTTFDRVFAINALHHFSDKCQFFQEARRVLSRGGGLLTVGLDPHQGIDEWWIYDYFPSTVAVDLKRYLPCEQIRKMMDDAGFEGCTRVEAQYIHGTEPALADIESNLISKNSTSQLALLSDEEYAEGLSRIRRDIRVAEAEGTRLDVGVDLRIYATIGWAV